MSRKKRPVPERAFGYRGGVRIEGSVIACDAPRGRDLAFISHAGAPLGRGRRRVLLTETTLALLGEPGRWLRCFALVAAYGRPFVLGSTRIELFPAGSGPGTASLACEVNARRVVYAGALGGAGILGGAAPEVRAADALCLDAALDGRVSLPPRAEALDGLRRAALDLVAAGRAPVVLTEDPATALDAARALSAAGVPARAHASVIAAAAAYRRAGVDVPSPERFSGRLKPGEALLWRLGSRDAAVLRALVRPAFLLASGSAGEEAALQAARADLGIGLSSRADFGGLVRYSEETGASEVAVTGRFAEELCAALRARGHAAYVLGPPSQMGLFDAPAVPG